MDFPHPETVYFKQEISDDESQSVDSMDMCTRYLNVDIVKPENEFYPDDKNETDINQPLLKPETLDSDCESTKDENDDDVKLESPSREECTIKDEAETHTVERPFKCKLCLKMFTRKGRLNRHMKTHTGEKPFECRICAKKFSEYGNLHRHMQIHTGEKPFECEFCSNKFSRKANAQRHMRTHLGEKPYACTTCPKNFSELGHLKEHMRMHTATEPLVCEVCQKKFLWKTSFKRHMGLHADALKKSSKTNSELK